MRSGVCPDYVDLHDGQATTDPTLNTQGLMCGSSLVNTTYSSTGTYMTVHFVTDNTAVYLGFNIIFTAATSGILYIYHMMNLIMSKHFLGT